MKAKKRYFIDLFAGCGGLSVGFEQAGMIPLLFNEINPNANASYRNYINNKFNIEFVPDVKDLTPSKIKDLKIKWQETGIKEIDVIAGGPPCWGYSRIGHRRTFNTDKKNIGTNHLYNYMVKVIKHFEPKLFLFENVMGLKSARWTKNGKKGEIWEAVQASFDGLKKYNIQSDLIHCYDYGIPQNRPRVILIGIRKDLGWQDVEGKPCKGRLPNKIDKAAPTIVEMIGDLIDVRYQETLQTLKYPTTANSEMQRDLRICDKKLMRKGSVVYNHEYSNHRPATVEKFKYMIKHGLIPDKMQTKKFAQKVLPRKWPNGKPNITITSLPDDYVHYEQPRSLTVRECARLQTFPDNFVFYGPRTTGGRRRAGEPENNFETREIPQYTQVGNAVPVKLAKYFGEHFLRIINSSGT